MVVRAALRRVPDQSWRRRRGRFRSDAGVCATATYPVTVVELSEVQRDRVFDEQARRAPGFAAYAKKTAGIRTIPVLALKRV